MVKLGRRVFQARSFTPIVLLALIAVPFAHPPTLGSVMSGVVFMLCGILLRVWCVHHATSGTRTRQDQTHPLCTTGPYALTRNPLYLANIVIYSSVAWLITHHVGWTVLAVGFFMMQYHLIVRYEENLCRSLFGQAYLEYTQQVPRWSVVLNRQQWLSMLAKGQEPWQVAFMQERRGMLAIAIAMGVFWLKQRWFV